MTTTNFAAVVIISLLTNSVEDVHQDGTRKTVIEKVTKTCVHQWSEDGVLQSHTTVSVKTNISRYRLNWELIRTTPPPLPTRSIMPIKARMAPMVLASSVPVILTPRFANGSETTNEFCRMFRVDFETETNWIYGLECTTDLIHWDRCLPEIDGTGEPDFFFDIDEGSRSYRIVRREGVLPAE
jgi:hypothetical protein